jgi:putative two-component system response regulator
MITKPDFNLYDEEHINDVWTNEYRRITAEICRHHHERYDGNGYPDRLEGEAA